MKLAVSNIAWENSELVEHLALLRDLNCHGVELAPSCIWSEPVDASFDERARVRRLIQGFGLDITGFHALLYTRPDLQLFKDTESLARAVAYLTRLAQLCSDLEGKILVFGSPKNRVRNGRSYAECMQWATNGLRTVAEACEPLGVTICIEPLGPDETEFISCSREGMELVASVDHLNFGLHLDAKAIVGAREDFQEVFRHFGKHVRHFHVGDPGLAPPGSTGVDHACLGRAMREAGYDEYVSIEMRRGFGPTRDVIAKSVRYVRRCYLNKE